jgi:hypothetical protein
MGLGFLALNRSRRTITPTPAAFKGDLPGTDNFHAGSLPGERIG